MFLMALWRCVGWTPTPHEEFTTHELRCHSLQQQNSFCKGTKFIFEKGRKYAQSTTTVDSEDCDFLLKCPQMETEEKECCHEMSSYTTTPTLAPSDSKHLTWHVPSWQRCTKRQNFLKFVL